MSDLPLIRHFTTCDRAFSSNRKTIQENLDGKAVDWMEKVTDEQYRK